MKRLLKPIYSSAVNRKNLADWLEERTFPAMEVLAQLYLFPNTEYENHWRQELFSRFNSVKLLKGNKLPTKKFLINSTIEADRKYASRIIQLMIDKEYLLTPKSGYNTKEYLELCDEYFDWLCTELSQKRTIFRHELYSKLDDMGL